MSNLGLSQLLEVRGFQGPCLIPDERLAVLEAPPTRKRRALYPNQHALHSELICQNGSSDGRT